MRTGCRCRKMFDSMTSTRLRSVLGRSWRNTDVQTCVSVSQFQNLVPGPSFGAIVLVSAIFDLCYQLSAIGYRLSAIGLRLEKRLRIGPLAKLVLEMPRFVDEDLPIVGQDHARALERARRWSLEIDPGRAEAAAVARALELVFRAE